MNGSVKLSLSIDWEDFGQLCCRDFHGVITKPRPHDIERQTNKILEMLDAHGKKATFFVLGMLAKHRGELVRKIDSLGHEIALHGNNHVAMSALSRQEAREDLADSYKLVTDIIGKPIAGYRAPYFSINEGNLYVLELLAEMGIEYDSSIFPKKLPRYGIEDFNQQNCYYRLPNNLSIVELPLTLLNWRRKKIPVAGGGYIRIMPLFVLERAYRRLRQEHVDPMVYMHPYEFDSQPIDCSASFPGGRSRSPRVIVKNLKWNLLRGSIIKKVEFLLKTFDFITCKEKAENVRNYTKCRAVLGSEK